MRAPGTSAMVLLRALVHAGAAVGVNRDELLAKLQVTPAQLEEDTSVPTLLLAYAWRLSPEMSGDPYFGLHAGQHAELGSYDVLDYLFFTSATLGDACRAVQRYYRIITDIWRIEMIVDDKIARFRHWVPNDYVEPLFHAWDYFFSGAYKRMRSVVAGDYRPTTVHLMRSAPADKTEYEKTFGCPVEFGHPIGEFVFDKSLLDMRLVSSNPALHRLVRRHAEELLARVPSDRDLLTRARTLLPELLPNPNLSITLLATRLGVGERTLQRSLAEHGITYKQLIDRTREEHAVRGLEAGVLSMLEIATSVGFNSPAAFTRAFRRWRGTSPTEYQKKSETSGPLSVRPSRKP